jgi:hypothetical protein
VHVSRGDTAWPPIVWADEGGVTVHGCCEGRRVGCGGNRADRVEARGQVQLHFINALFPENGFTNIGALEFTAFGDCPLVLIVSQASRGAMPCGKTHFFSCASVQDVLPRHPSLRMSLTALPGRVAGCKIKAQQVASRMGSHLMVTPRYLEDRLTHLTGVGSFGRVAVPSGPRTGPPFPAAPICDCLSSTPGCPGDMPVLPRLQGSCRSVSGSAGQPPTIVGCASFSAILLPRWSIGRVQSRDAADAAAACACCRGC